MITIKIPLSIKCAELIQGDKKASIINTLKTKLEILGLLVDSITLIKDKEQNSLELHLTNILSTHNQRLDELISSIEQFMPIIIDPPPKHKESPFFALVSAGALEQYGVAVSDAVKKLTSSKETSGRKLSKSPHPKTNK